MHRIVVFHTKPLDVTSWQPSLERDFEVTFIINENSLLPLLQAWQPHVLIYAEAKIRAPFLQNILSSTAHFNMGLMVIAPHYELRQELLAFQAGADHYLLATTPIESLRARIHSLSKKSDYRSVPLERNDTPTSLLPQRAVTLSHKDLVVHIQQNILHYKEELMRITPTQMRILTELIKRPGELLTREWLHKHVFDNAPISLRSIDAQIAKLKKAVPYLQTTLVNIYGRGYLLNVGKKDVA